MPAHDRRSGADRPVCVSSIGLRLATADGKVAVTMTGHVTDETDDDLAQRAAVRDDAALQQLYERHFSTVFRIVAAWPGVSREQAEDIVQETWMRAVRSPPQFQPGRYVAWLLKIAENVWTDDLRRRRGGIDIAEQPLAEDERRQPERIAETNEDHRRLRECLDRLPTEFGDVVRPWMHGDSYDHISKALTIPIQTVGSRLSRAKEKLADCLGGRRA